MLPAFAATGFVAGPAVGLKGLLEGTKLTPFMLKGAATLAFEGTKGFIDGLNSYPVVFIATLLTTLLLA